MFQSRETRAREKNIIDRDESTLTHDRTIEPAVHATREPMDHPG